jgi:hypothetical protein
MNDVSARRFPVWGWLDASESFESARKLVLGFRIEGLLAHGVGARALADAARSWKTGLKVYEVVGEAVPGAASAECVAMSLETFTSATTDPRNPFRDVALKVLLADALTRGQIDQARATATGDYLVVRKFAGAAR